MKSSMLKFISCSGVRSLDLDRHPWLDRPWSDELRDERILKSGVSLACLSRAVRADVPSSSYPLMHAPFVLPQVSSLHPFPALGARYLFLRVRSLSGPLLSGWLAVRSTRSIELISISSSPSYIVPVHPLVAPPVLFRLADFQVAAPYASTPCWRSGMVHRFYRSYSECLRHFPFLC